jgi:hypothetical protein
MGADGDLRFGISDLKRQDLKLALLRILRALRGEFEIWDLAANELKLAEVDQLHGFIAHGNAINLLAVQTGDR